MEYPVNTKSILTKRRYRNDVAVRMIGHLLEHHGTFGTMAEDIEGYSCAFSYGRANKWCLLGAIYIIALRLNKNSQSLQKMVGAFIPKHFVVKYSHTNINKMKPVVRFWDNATKLSQLRFARKLQRYGL